jgi:hypothetical protein
MELPSATSVGFPANCYYWRGAETYLYIIGLETCDILLFAVGDKPPVSLKLLNTEHLNNVLNNYIL